MPARWHIAACDLPPCLASFLALLIVDRLHSCFVVSHSWRAAVDEFLAKDTWLLDATTQALHALLGNGSHGHAPAPSPAQPGDSSSESGLSRGAIVAVVVTVVCAVSLLVSNQLVLLHCLEHRSGVKDKSIVCQECQVVQVGACSYGKLGCSATGVLSEHSSMVTHKIICNLQIRNTIKTHCPLVSSWH